MDVVLLGHTGTQLALKREVEPVQDVQLVLEPRQVRQVVEQGSATPELLK